MSEELRDFDPGAGRRKKAKSANAIAQLVLDAKRLPGGHAGFIEDAAGNLYEYNGRHWQRLHSASALALAFQHDEPTTTTDKRRREIVNAIRVHCHRALHEWGRVDTHEVPCANGVVDCRNRRLRPHRPEDYIDSVIPHAFDPGARSPTLDQALIDWFGEIDDGRARAIQMFAGYVVLPHARFKKALLLHGEGDTGKSVLPLLLRALVGPDRTATLAPSDMDDPVKLSVIDGKRLNMLTELDAEAVIRDGIFKTLVATEEPVLINPKYEEARMIRPIAKHVIATNVLPSLNDRSSATYNRLLIVPYTRVFARSEMDRHFLDKLTAEIGGVLAWAIEGARMLIEAGGEFPEIASAAELLTELRAQANPVGEFLREHLVPEMAAAVSLTKICEAFNKWPGAGKRLDARRVGKLARLAGYPVATVYVGERQNAAGIKGFRLAREDELRATAPPD